MPELTQGIEAISIIEKPTEDDISSKVDNHSSESNSDDEASNNGVTASHGSDTASLNGDSAYSSHGEDRSSKAPSDSDGESASNNNNNNSSSSNSAEGPKGTAGGKEVPKANRKKAVYKVPPQDNSPAVLKDGRRSLTLLESLSLKSPNESCHPDAVEFAARHFSRRLRCELPSRLYRMFNRDVFDLDLPEEITIKWSQTLVNKASMCVESTKAKTKERSVFIKLSAQKLTTAELLRDSLLHELCHAAAWLIDRVDEKHGHGDVFKRWAKRANDRFPELPEITEVHN